MTQQDIQQLSKLQSHLIDLKKRIAAITSACLQLSTDKCSTIIAFDLHNIDQHEKNKAESDTTTFTGIAFYMGMPVPGVQGKTCNTHAMIAFTETPALRILSVMLRELQEEERKINIQISGIFNHLYKADIVLNPVLELNQNTLP